MLQYDTLFYNMKVQSEFMEKSSDKKSVDIWRSSSSDGDDGDDRGEGDERGEDQYPSCSGDDIGTSCWIAPSSKIEGNDTRMSVVRWESRKLLAKLVIVSRSSLEAICLSTRTF